MLQLGFLPILSRSTGLRLFNFFYFFKPGLIPIPNLTCKAKPDFKIMLYMQIQLSQFSIFN